VKDAEKETALAALRDELATKEATKAKEEESGPSSLDGAPKAEAFKPGPFEARGTPEDGG
jgi:hypothetical protein